MSTFKEKHPSLGKQNSLEIGKLVNAKESILRCIAPCIRNVYIVLVCANIKLQISDEKNKTLFSRQKREYPKFGGGGLVQFELH